MPFNKNQLDFKFILISTSLVLSIILVFSLLYISIYNKESVVSIKVDNITNEHIEINKNNMVPGKKEKVSIELLFKENGTYNINLDFVDNETYNENSFNDFLLVDIYVDGNIYKSISLEEALSENIVILKNVDNNKITNIIIYYYIQEENSSITKDNDTCFIVYVDIKKK